MFALRFAANEIVDNFDLTSLRWLNNDAGVRGTRVKGLLMGENELRDAKCIRQKKSNAHVYE